MCFNNKSIIRIKEYKKKAFALGDLKCKVAENALNIDNMSKMPEFLHVT